MTFPPDRDGLFLAAYWTRAGESVEDIAGRLSRFLGSIAGVDPSLSSWFRATDPGRGELVDPAPGTLAAGWEAAWAQPHVDRDLSRLLGVAAALSTSRADDDAIGARCGPAGAGAGTSPAATACCGLPARHEDRRRCCAATSRSA